MKEGIGARERRIGTDGRQPAPVRQARASGTSAQEGAVSCV